MATIIPPKKIRLLAPGARSIYWKDNWDSDKYIEYMSLDEKKHVRILALFAKIKEYKFENYNQVNFYIKRYARSARRLEAFEEAQIENVLKYLLATANYKVALETIEKFILEDVSILKGDEPIIILKEGEKVTDISRLRELEIANQIYWDTKDEKWYER